MAARTLAALAWLLPCAALGQDPVALYPENYRVLHENDRVRVIDFRLARGASEEAHHHRPHVVYVLEGFRIRFTFPDGSTALRETKAGDVLFSEEVTHASENVGETDAHGVLVELKAGSAATASAAPLTALTFIRGRPGRGDELERELLALTAPTRAEPGALRYDLYRSKTDADAFVRFEEWRDEAALEAHKETPHLKGSFEKRRQQGWSTEITLWERVAGQ